MTGLPTAEALEALLARARTALEAGDAEAAALAVAGALAHLDVGPAPPNLERLLAAHAAVSELADREASRISGELALLGSSRRAAGAYRSG